MRTTNPYCIICREKEKRDGSLFCGGCFNKDIFIKLKHFRVSPEFKVGWLKGNPSYYGRLPTPEQRERQKNAENSPEHKFRVFWR